MVEVFKVSFSLCSKMLFRKCDSNCKKHDMNSRTKKSLFEEFRKVQRLKFCNNNNNHDDNSSNVDKVIKNIADSNY